MTDIDFYLERLKSEFATDFYFHEEQLKKYCENNNIDLTQFSSQISEAYYNWAKREYLKHFQLIFKKFARSKEGYKNFLKQRSWLSNYLVGGFQMSEEDQKKLDMEKQKYIRHFKTYEKSKKNRSQIKYYI